MFKFNKKNIALRGSPKKPGSLSSRCSLQSINSPAKRIRLTDHVQMMSSTFVHDLRSDNSIRPNHQSSRPEVIRYIPVPEQPTVTHKEVPKTNVSVVTPPPTPEIVRTTTRLDMLARREALLSRENEELDRKLEAKVDAIEKCSKEISELKASRYKYDDMVEIVSLAQNQLRDNLNKIFSPGNEFAGKFATLMQEVRAKHTRKLEKKSIELNNYLDQSESAILKKMEDLSHEIDIHQRTLLHQEYLTNAQEKAETEANTNQEVEKMEVQEQSIQEDNQSAKKQDEQVIQEPVEDKGDADDCIIIESNDVSEEIVREHSVEMTESKREVVDDEETDIDNEYDSGDEPQRPFTPCQAQRPN